MQLHPEPRIISPDVNHVNLSANIQTVVNFISIVLATSLLDDSLTDNVNQSVPGRSTMKAERISELSDLINYGNSVDDNEDVLICVDSRIINK